ncbi:transcription elongation protein SprT [Xanthovirga aplysinae]|uniref:transcription elongation protein SprT n=1 Tax=Xanthovirga aplysinae TaxID=2529853 RepID=UPI0012BC1BED|nr:transcription elongation protein SprT [Xanthovirga aplysinae]MTI32439.1 transcription elongation protein SprT [Xanthovirga aplysinae]
MSANRLRGILKNYVPAEALDYCVFLWEENPFHFQITKNRLSKLGDYRFDPINGTHKITVNFNLNSYAFVLTYIHEVAHLVVTKQFGHKVLPHGSEWKKTFKGLFSPLLKPEIFPEDLLKALITHMRSPKASSTTDHQLCKILKNYNEGSAAPLNYLSDMGIGEEFTFQGRRFKKEAKKRTRSLCLEVSTGKRYLISEMATVDTVEEYQKA